MSRTTTALKRLGVPGIAAATMVAGLPLFLGSASAAHIQSISLTPETQSASAGVCVPFTVQVNFTTPQQATAENVDVVISEASGTGTAAPATQDVDFCTATSIGSDAPQAPIEPTDTGAAGTSDRAEFRTDAAGKVTFGVVANDQGTVNVQAFYETTDNDVFNAGEFQDTASATFGTGGEAGSNENQDAATRVEVISATATATTDTDADNVVEGETRTYRVFVNGTSGRLAGVTVNFAVNSDVDAADRGSAVFGVTNNDGIATGTITFPVRTTTDGANSTDTVTFFVNQTGVTSTPGADTLEPRDTLTVTVRDAAFQTNRTVTLSEDQTFTGTDRDASFTAVVDDPRTTGADASTAGTLLSFGVSGGSGDETVTVSNQTSGGAANECTTVANAAGSDANDSVCTVTVTDPTPVTGQVLTVTATVRGSGQSDTATLTAVNQPSDARFVDFTEETVTVAPNTARVLTARVTDVDGNPVAGVNVRFTETGAGAFRNGNSIANVTTNENGVATVETLSLPGETGTQTVTADIRFTATGGTQNNQSTQAANAGTDPQGNALNTTTNTGAAGRPTDTVTVTFAQPAPSPSATNTATTPPSTTPPTQGADCTKTPTIVLERSTIIATGRTGYRVVGGPANAAVQIFAYSQPSTTYIKVRDVALGADGNGPGGDGFVPPTNTRLYAQVVGCDTDESRFSVVINVRTQISLNVVRNGTKNYTFSGRLLPARRGGLIASLYRVTNDGRQILTAQTRADASTGRYTINRRFTGTGRFGFVVRTGQDLQNAPGSSNVRSLLVF